MTVSEDHEFGFEKNIHLTLACFHLCCCCLKICEFKTLAEVFNWSICWSGYTTKGYDDQESKTKISLTNSSTGQFVILTATTNSLLSYSSFVSPPPSCYVSSSTWPCPLLAFDPLCLKKRIEWNTLGEVPCCEPPIACHSHPPKRDTFSKPYPLFLFFIFYLLEMLHQQTAGDREISESNIFQKSAA